MAKKAHAKKAPAKRKPRAKKPVQPAIELSEKDVVKSIVWRSWLVGGVKAVALIAVGAVAGVYASGGIEIGPEPVVRNDVLQQSYDADRISQATILREYASQGFVNDDAGRKQAMDWFNANRFRNRGPDFRPYTTEVANRFAAGTLVKFADELEGK